MTKEEKTAWFYKVKGKKIHHISWPDGDYCIPRIFNEISGIFNAEGYMPSLPHLPYGFNGAYDIASGFDEHAGLGISPGRGRWEWLEEEVKSVKRECVCEREIVFHQGCKCGAMERERAMG